MKRCLECRKDYLDDSLLYCLDDGTPLVQGAVSDEPATEVDRWNSDADLNHFAAIGGFRSFEEIWSTATDFGARRQV